MSRDMKQPSQLKRSATGGGDANFCADTEEIISSWNCTQCCRIISGVVDFPFLFCARLGQLKVKVILDHYLQGEAYLELVWYLQFYRTFIWATSPSLPPSIPLFRLPRAENCLWHSDIMESGGILNCGESYAKSFLKAMGISESGVKSNGCG